MDWIISAIILIFLAYYSRKYIRGIWMIREGELVRGKKVLKKTFFEFIVFVFTMTLSLIIYFLLIQ